MIVHAETAEGGRAVFAVADPPTAEDLDRWRLLASLPGLAEATWSGEAGDSSVPRAAPPPKG